jgi:hypothetical protein
MMLNYQLLLFLKNSKLNYFAVKVFDLIVLDCIHDLLMISDKEAVEKRLYVLQQQGYIYATEST